MVYKVKHCDYGIFIMPYDPTSISKTNALRTPKNALYPLSRRPSPFLQFSLNPTSIFPHLINISFQTASKKALSQKPTVFHTF